MAQLDCQKAASLCNVFASNLKIGTGYNKCIEMLRNLKLPESLIKDLEYALFEQGMTLSASFEYAKVLDPTAHRLINAAERTGTLPMLFSELKEEYERRLRVSKEVFSQSLRILVGVALVFVLMELFDAIIQINIKGSALDYGMYILRGALKGGIFLGFVYFFYLVWTMLPVSSPAFVIVKGISTHIPFVSRAPRLFSLSNFCIYFSRALGTGLSAYESIELAISSTRDPRYQSCRNQVIQALENGETMTRALREIHDLPSGLLDLIMVGEETGTLTEELEAKGNEYYEEALKETENSTNMMVTAIKIGGTVFFGAFYLWKLSNSTILSF